ncbi:hypothetical protein [Microbacterium aerolatum]|uniref:hypothetical protein n=1 Tax=Microbacterium aerolatum TaxID=153731 RepID=UPI00384B5ACF
MVYRDDSSLEAQVAEILRRIRVLETQAPVGFTSVTRGALRVASNEGLLVEGSAKVDGWLVVTGTERVTGRLEGSGTFDWTGPMNLRGAQSVTGPTTFTGQVTVNGPWDLNGNGDITGNVVVRSGGAITVQGPGGNVTLSSSYSAPRINLGGAQIDGGSALTFTAGTTVIYFANGTIRIAGIPTRSGTGLPAGAVGADPDGSLWRAV